MKSGLAMVLGLAALFWLGVTDSATAISRYNSTTMTCERAKQIIAREGAVIIRYPSKRSGNLVLHDRFVRNARNCQLDEFAARKFIPTADTNRCKLRHCKSKEVGGKRRRGGISNGTVNVRDLFN